MMSASLSGSARNSSRSPFTPNQWQELEQQALVFKYMVTGTPIPPDLIFSIKRSLDSSISSRLFPHHPIGYAYFQMGFGRKVDPEPGRCRRTDGKKWRCSKEAYPDSKYCERHMHRGRNRSRKPVEISSSSTTNVMNHHHQSSYTVNCTNDSNNNNNMASSTACSFSFNPSESQQQHQYFSQSYQNPFFYTQSTSSSSSSKHHDADFPPHDATTHHLFMDSGSYSHDQKDYSRHIHGMREDVDERAFFPEASGSARSYLHDSYQHHHQQQQQHLSIMNNNSNNDDPRNQEQHCFVLGTDFKSTSKEKDNTEKTTSTTQQRPLHHFFGEWPPKNTDSWLDLASNSRIPSSGIYIYIFNDDYENLIMFLLPHILI
ncbi:hypothetical protein Ahy_B09g095768 isoform D [Arachis hypogaea]|uniref:Growth-regulating factor n=1 Tax=Arachis hypogaea TaxID=3818 RepID=A0A444XGQ4_ARAHY|nr:hypothetical protein Ahy_B09g095768 isoform D [Arachis hypogaea]